MPAKGRATMDGVALECRAGGMEETIIITEEVRCYVDLQLRT